MRHYLLLITLLALSCQDKKEMTSADDVAGMRTQLAEKKKELKSLKQDIDKLTKDLYRLDPPKEKTAAQVKVQKLEATEFKRFVVAQGQVTAEDKINVSSDIGGRITSLTVREGDYVKKGQLVAVTDMLTVENQIAELQTSIDLATTVFERQERLWKQNIGSELQFIEAKSNKDRLEQSMATLKSQISKKNIYAPISGIVEMEYLKQGETAGPGMPIFQILNTGKTKVVANLQESMLNSVKKGDLVDVYYPALDKTEKSKITMLGRSIDPANRTFKVEIAANSQGGKLKPNLMAEVKFSDLTEKNAVVIPLNVLQEDVAGNKYVYRVKDENGKKTAEKVLIELGESSADGVIVLIGLQAGDNLITDGANKLNNEDPIVIIQ